MPAGVKEQNCGHCIHYVPDKRTKCRLLQNEPDNLVIIELNHRACSMFTRSEHDCALKGVLPCQQRM